LSYLDNDRCRFALFFFFQAEDGIRDFHVTGVQTCALPIYLLRGNDDSCGHAHAYRPLPRAMATAVPLISNTLSAGGQEVGSSRRVRIWAARRAADKADRLVMRIVAASFYRSGTSSAPSASRRSIGSAARSSNITPSRSTTTKFRPSPTVPRSPVTPGERRHSMISTLTSPASWTTRARQSASSTASHTDDTGAPGMPHTTVPRALASAADSPRHAISVLPSATDPGAVAGLTAAAAGTGGGAAAARAASAGRASGSRTMSG